MPSVELNRIFTEATMDYWIIKAEAEAKDGSRGTVSCKFHERDSESTSNEECAMLLMMAADR